MPRFHHLSFNRSTPSVRRSGTLALTLSLALAACAAPPPPPVAVAPPPPPAPVVVAPPPRPLPPSGAMLAMMIPPRLADGRRDTPIRDLDADETIWAFRSAFNVAALNCQSAAHYRLADDYNKFLATHRRELDRVNRAVEAKYRKTAGPNYKRVRDTETTSLYNFFALPPVKYDFCDAALVLGPEASAIPSKDLGAFASRALPQLEAVFDRFFMAYENYQTELANWMARYGSNDSQTSSVTTAQTYP